MSALPNAGDDYHTRQDTYVSRAARSQPFHIIRTMFHRHSIVIALFLAPGNPQGFEETGSGSRDIPGLGITAHSSPWSNHTYETAW
jgi:hypothetical protein